MISLVKLNKVLRIYLLIVVELNSLSLKIFAYLILKIWQKKKNQKKMNKFKIIIRMKIIRDQIKKMMLRLIHIKMYKNSIKNCKIIQIRRWILFRLKIKNQIKLTTKMMKHYKINKKTNKQNNRTTKTKTTNKIRIKMNNKLKIRI